MQPFVTMATLALVISVGGALRVVACEDGSYAMDVPVVTVPQQVADCTGQGCATDEPVVTTPQVANPCNGLNCARPEPKLETVLKELDNTTVHAVKNADDPMKAFACATSPNCATPEPTVSTAPQ
jgi:threonine dehydratase